MTYPYNDEDELTKDLDGQIQQEAAPPVMQDPTRRAFYQDLLKRAQDRMGKARAAQGGAPTQADYDAANEGSRNRAMGELFAKSAALAGSTGGHVADTSALSGFNKAIDETAKRDLGSREAIAQRAKTDEEAAVKDIVSMSKAKGETTKAKGLIQELDDGVWLIDPYTGAKISKLGKKNLKPKDGPSDADKYADARTRELRTEWNSNQTTKDTYNIMSAYNKVDRAAQAKNPTPADDMSLIYGFMKLQDPGSTVREGEYASAENARGVPDTVLNMYNKVRSGTRLTPEQRANFISAAGQLYDAHNDVQEQVDNRYIGLAKEMGVNPALVTDGEFAKTRTKRRSKKAPDDTGGIASTLVPPAIASDSAPQQVKMQAPDGSTKWVPAASVKKYQDMGAKVVQ